MPVSLYQLNPVVAPFVRRLIGPGTPETEVLQPSETVSVRPPAFLPGALDRVTATDENSTLSYHRQVAIETTVTHVPVLRHTYRNALVRRRGFATLRQHERYGSGFGPGDLFGPVDRVPLLRYCHSWVIWKYFGHWLTDAISAAMIDPGRGALWMPADPSWMHAPAYVRALDLAVRPDAPVLADELIAYQDFGQGSHKARRYAQIRDLLQSRFGGDGSHSVYIRRNRTGAPRWIANDDELIEALLARSWRIIDIATASVEDLQHTLCRAEVVVSIDGSHIDHAHLSLRPGSTMVVLVPQDRFTLQHIGLARAHGVKPGFVVLEGTMQDGYRLDINELLRTVDLADTQP